MPASIGAAKRETQPLPYIVGKEMFSPLRSGGPGEGRRDASERSEVIENRHRKDLDAKHSEVIVQTKPGRSMVSESEQLVWCTRTRNQDYWVVRFPILRRPIP